jgi:hypothetical protein
MKTTVFWTLVALNGLLLAMFLGRGHENAAMAQPQRLAAGSYLAVPGTVIGGGGAEVVYILDTRNNLLTAVQQNKAQVNAMPPINLTRVFGGR